MKKPLSFIIILLFFISKHSFSQERAILDSLFTELEDSKTDVQRASIYQNIGFQYIHINSDSAEYFTNKAIQQFTKLNKPEGIVNASFNVSRIYLQKSESEKAADVLLKLLPNLIKAKNKTLEGECYNLLGEICRSAEDFKRALHFLNEANKISKQINNIELFAKSSNRTAAVYYEIKDFGLAIAYADSSLDVYKNNKDTGFIINNLDIKGASYNNLRQYNNAKLIYEDIIKIASDISIPSHILRNIAETYYNLENYEQSIEYGLMAYRSAEDYKQKNQIENSSFILSKSYEKTKEYKKAYKYSVISKNTYHDLFNERKNAQFAELNAKYESKKKEQEIEKQKEINKYDKLRLIQKQNENILLIVGIILVVFILIFISRQRKLAKKANSQLAIKNNEIHSKSKKLNELNEHLVKLGRFKEAMTGMIVHDLKNPLNIIINSDNVVYTKHAGRHMLMMVQNILDIQKFEEARLDINLNNESIFSLSQKAIKQVSLLVETKKIKVINNISEKYGVIADAEKTKRVFVNILTNAIKYTDNRGSIILNCQITENSSKIENESTGKLFYKVSVTDTGEGIPANKLDVIFDMFEQVEARNSGEIHSTGIGLTYCKLAIEAQSGNIWVESEIDKGSKFWFTLPKGEDINMVLPEVQHTKLELKLLPLDKQYLNSFIEALKELEVYDISEAEKILSKIDISKSVGIAEWKKIMKNTLFITDEDIFAELLNL